MTDQKGFITFPKESFDLSSDTVTSSMSDFNYFNLNGTGFMTCAIHKVRQGKELENIIAQHRFERIYLDTTWGLPA
jgi:hypothetical protein